MIDVHAIHHVTVNVTDLERAQAFYEKLLGLRPVPRPRSFKFAGAWYQLGPAQVHLLVRSEPDPVRTNHFALQVMDVDAAMRQLEGAGVEVDAMGGIPGITRFFIRDPDGNQIEIIGPDKPWHS